LGAYSFPEAVSLIDSVGHLSIKAAGYSWQGLAEAAGTDTSRLDGIAGRVVGDPGEGHPELASGLNRVSGWAGETGSYSSRVAEQLLHAGDVAASVYANRVSLEQEYNTLKARMDNPTALSGNAEVRDANRMSELTDQINGEISKLGSAFGAVQPSAPAAPPTSSGGGGDVGGPSAPSGAPMVQAANGVSVAPGHYPGSSVLGPESGDFAGWVTDPRTGFLIDPTTGREYDPATGRWIDPVTGKPFGDVDRYATHLEGLGGGSPVPTTTLGLGPGVNISGLYNGVTPPSLLPGNPAVPVLTQQATQGLAGKAYLAQRLAMREMGQGGRPFGMPAGATTPVTSRTGSTPARLVSERANAWRTKATAADRLSGGAGARRTPPPSTTASSADKKKANKHEVLINDRDAWSAEGRAGRGVLGEST
jgi:hypothetical protein